jgi:RNA polymerase sigma-70 factor (ECF subfamily)
VENGRSGERVVSDTVEVLEGWYRQHGPALLRYLRGSFGSGEAAEDLLHETFVQALRRADRVDSTVSPRAWLFAVARNVGVTWLRRRHATTPLPAEHPAKETRQDDPRLERVRQSLGRLPTPQREALELRLRDSLSYEEIADVLGIPVGTVRSRLHHAMRRLRDDLQGREE